MKNKILVLGANGKTGRKVVERLMKMNLSVRLGSRSADPKFDWQDSDNWGNVLEGISKVYITFQPDLAVPGAVEKIQQLVEKAKEARVKKLVLLSGRGEKEAEHCEDIIMNCGIDYTIVSASWFSQNFSESFLLDSILAGHVALPLKEISEPFTDVEDIADLVVEALTNNKHNGKKYELTGPRLLTFEQAIQEISEATNRSIAYHRISMEDYIASLKAYEVPEEEIWLMKYLFTEVLDGRNERLTTCIQDVLGRKPLDFSDYVKRTAISGIWTK